MKVLVPLKRVLDYNLKVRVKTDQTGVDLTGLKMSLNPFDEIALEEAIRLKEKGLVTEIIALTIGPKESQDILRTAFAMGCDRAVHVETTTALEPLGAAKVIHALVLKESPHFILMGKQGIDDDYNQTGQMTAGLLGWGQGTFASKVDFIDGRVYVTREVDGGLETLSIALPAVITTDLRLNEPRYLTLPNIMKAKQKPIESIPLSDLKVDTAAQLILKRVEEPKKRTQGIMVSSAAELLDKLQNEAKVI